MELFHSFWTLALLILFICLFAWAWSSKRKSEFDKASRLPLDVHLTLHWARGVNIHRASCMVL